jgi:hypothetical protein
MFVGMPDRYNTKFIRLKFIWSIILQEISYIDSFELIKKTQIALTSERNEPIKTQIAALPIVSFSNWITQLNPDTKPIIPNTKELNN